MAISRKRLAIPAAVAGAVILGGGLAALHVQADDGEAAAVAQAATVDVAEVVSRSVTDWQHYSGRLEAVERIEIRPLVSGTLAQVHFRDGSLVRQGDLLFSIDPRPYAAELARAQAQLAASEARVAYTASDLERAERLLADNAISRRDHEEKQNAAREAAAGLQGARAAVALARLDLGYTRITAPVSGRISRAEITAGNVVSAGAASVPLTTLVSVGRIYATFDVDEQSFLKYVNPSRSGQGGPVPVFLGLADETGYPRQGRVSSVDNRMDTSSGTIRVRAEFDNPDGVLLPGLYARIRLGAGQPREALLIDEKAVGTDQDKRFVLVLDKDNRAGYRQVRLGASQDGLRVVDEGLQAGERIVVNGLQRVHPGDVVTPQVVPMPGQAVAGKPAALRVADQS